MGAEWFEQYASGKTMEEAFHNGVEEAAWEYGHRGYTGSMAEKGSYVDMTTSFPKYSTDEELEKILRGIYHFPHIERDGTVSEHDYETKKFTKRAMTEQEKALAPLAKACDDKWGPAVGIKLANGQYLFFGWASS